jgi:hypothetical protein
MAKFRHIALIFATILISFSSCRKSEYVLEETQKVINDNGLGTGSTTWTKDKEYIIEGKVYVNDGQVLTIEAGTVIKARQGSGTAASALIVARGGKIIAEGTAVDPIIFTAESDDLEGSLNINDNGLWGGLIILGSASINTPTGEAHIEGIPISEPRGIFGGNNDQDNSGILRYVSIRHGGTDLGKDNEINGLTLGGVGSETIIDNIEVIANADDGVEIFGGTVNIGNLVVANCDDDAVDIDLGYRGNGQFWCLLQNSNYGDKLIEIDGGEEIKTAQPYTNPSIFNVTGVGRGTEYSNKLISFNDNAGGIIANSVFINQKEGIEIEYSSVRDNSFTQWQNGNLQIKNNIFYNINGNQSSNFFLIYPLNNENVNNEQLLIDSYYENAENRFADPEFEQFESSIMLISDNAELFTNFAPLPDNNFFETANYIGAFDNYNWIGEWTLTYTLGLVY